MASLLEHDLQSSSRWSINQACVDGFDIRTGIGPDLSRQVDQLLARWIPSLRSEPENDETPAAAGVRSGAKGN